MEATAVGIGHLAEQINLARAESDRFFSILHPKAIYQRPIAERHRVIFYIGHLDAFDYIQICREGLGMKSSEPGLDRLFQAGIDPDADELPADTPDDWPSLARVQQYVRQARAAVDRVLEQAPPLQAEMAIEHRLMHLETLAYMFHNFDHDCKVQPEVDAVPAEATVMSGDAWCPVDGGEAVLGQRSSAGAFGWDNEFEEVRVDVPSFRMQKYNVTNDEYLQFVKDGAPRPHFWTERNGQLFYRGMFAEIALPLSWPVYVTQREAQAYASWLGKDLPSEAQFQRAAYGTPSGSQRAYPWGNSGPAQRPGNFDFRRWDPAPVNAYPKNQSVWGISNLVGNGWEWTNTVFGPFPGFHPHPSYPGYSANFFDGQHYVLKGGSPLTAAPLLRRSFRNWFRPDYPYVYATFRCVEN